MVGKVTFTKALMKTLTFDFQHLIPLKIRTRGFRVEFLQRLSGQRYVIARYVSISIFVYYQDQEDHHQRKTCSNANLYIFV